MKNVQAMVLQYLEVHNIHPAESASVLPSLQNISSETNNNDM